MCWTSAIGLGESGFDTVLRSSSTNRTGCSSIGCWQDPFGTSVMCIVSSRVIDAVEFSVGLGRLVDQVMAATVLDRTFSRRHWALMAMQAELTSMGG